ncbi:small secreted protein [Streptomyces sp. HNM0574]|uniref:small secreted protein n=1 Tax=Streptomyces sp. HNM0574 TaxID=2714954 RepID=UPI00146DAEDD|nr:small secreted protein [Streptomyces sp. HNM0574]NLU67889.1 small secreted protein [Streptomyces sp. HNM0574]
MEGTDPVNKKLVAALSSGAALVLTLTGCGDDSGKKTEEWAKKVCDQVQPQVKKIQQANASIGEASEKKQSSAEVKKTDSAAFQDISDAYKALGTAVDKAGAPPVDDGEKLQKDAVKELKGISKEYAGLKRTVDKLDTKDQAKFAEGLKGVATELDKLGKSGDKALSDLQSGEVGEAMAKQKGCKRPDTSEAPSS